MTELTSCSSASSHTDAVIHARPVLTFPAGLQSVGRNWSVHEEVGRWGEQIFFFFLSPWSLSSISSAAWPPHELLTSAGCVIYPLKLNWCFDHPQTPEQRFHPRFSRCSFTAASRCEHCLLQYMRSLYYIIIFLIFLCLVWLSAGSAGDRLSHGEEGNGAQTRHHSAEGESILFKAFLYGPT